MKKLVITSAALYALPLLAFAQSPFGQNSGANLGPLRTLVRAVGDILNALIPILIVIAILFFFWGLIQYIRKPEGGEGRKIMIAGLIALFIMVSIWGIVRFMQSSLGIYDNTSIQPPAVPQQNI